MAAMGILRHAGQRWIRAKQSQKLHPDWEPQRWQWDDRWASRASTTGMESWAAKSVAEANRRSLKY